MQKAFEDVQITFLGGEAPARTDPDHPFVKLVVDAADGIYQKTNAVGTHGRRFWSEPCLCRTPPSADCDGWRRVIRVLRPMRPNENIRIDLYEHGVRQAYRADFEKVW
jgi:hypothetical protein